jgi:hypothetical protein
MRQRPPLAPVRQRQASNNMQPLPGPSRLRLAGTGTSVQNKEIIPVMNKAVVDKAERERISVCPDKRPMSRLSHIQMPRRVRATYNSIQQAAAEPAADATPDVRGKFKGL